MFDVAALLRAAVPEAPPPDLGAIHRRALHRHRRKRQVIGFGAFVAMLVILAAGMPLLDRSPPAETEVATASGSGTTLTEAQARARGALCPEDQVTPCSEPTPTASSGEVARLRSSCVNGVVREGGSGAVFADYGGRLGQAGKAWSAGRCAEMEQHLAAAFGADLTEWRHTSTPEQDAQREAALDEAAAAVAASRGQGPLPQLVVDAIATCVEGDAKGLVQGTRPNDEGMRLQYLGGYIAQLEGAREYHALGTPHSDAGIAWARGECGRMREALRRYYPAELIP